MFSSFMVNSWIVGTMVALVAAIVGMFVILRGDSFAAHALPLGTFPGAAAAALLGVDPLPGLIAFSALGVGGMVWLGRRERNEVATALTLVTLLGIGTLFLSFTAAYSQSVYALLFGEVLGVSRDQVVLVGILSLMVVGIVILLFRRLLLLAVSPELSAARGVARSWTDLAFMSVLGLATAMALPVVGTLLVFSLMVGPASAACLLSRTPAGALTLAVGIGLAVVWAGLALSYWTNWPVGFFIGTLSALAYASARGLAGFGRMAARYGWRARPG